MYGKVVSYTGEVLTVSVISYGGGEAHADWLITPSGPAGAAGASGAPGTSRATTVATAAVVNVNRDVDLANGKTVGGLAVSTGQIVALVAQANAAENGIYTVPASAWHRATPTSRPTSASAASSSTSRAARRSARSTAASRPSAAPGHDAHQLRPDPEPDRHGRRDADRGRCRDRRSRCTTCFQDLDFSTQLERIAVNTFGPATADSSLWTADMTEASGSGRRVQHPQPRFGARGRCHRLRRQHRRHLRGLPDAPRRPAAPHRRRMAGTLPRRHDRRRPRRFRRADPGGLRRPAALDRLAHCTPTAGRPDTTTKFEPRFAEYIFRQMCRGGEHPGRGSGGVDTVTMDGLNIASFTTSTARRSSAATSRTSATRATCCARCRPDQRHRPRGGERGQHVQRLPRHADAPGTARSPTGPARARTSTRS